MMSPLLSKGGGHTLCSVLSTVTTRVCVVKLAALIFFSGSEFVEFLYKIQNSDRKSVV